MIRVVMFLVACLPLAGVACSADPGLGLPLFRRNQSAAPQVAPQKKPTAAVEVSPPVTPVGVTAEQTVGQEVDTAEVIRRGDRVVPAGRGPMSTEDQLMGDATAPPPDDSHKWFFSVIVDDSKESQALLYDLKQSPSLRAWINLEDQKTSWSHTTVYVAKDQTQDWRWKNLKISRYPVIVLQPPAKLANESDPASWEWGDPKTVVWQWDGYDATSPNRAKIRSDAIRQALTLYVTKMSERRTREQVVGPRSRSAPAATPGAGKLETPGAGQAEAFPGMKQDHGAPPFQMPVFPTLPGTNPVVQSDPTQPSAPVQVQTGSIGLVMSLVQQALGSGGFWIFVLVGLKVFELFAKSTPSPVDDQVAAFIRSIVDQNQNPIKIDPTK